MAKKAPKSNRANDLSGAVFDDVKKSRRSKNIIVTHDKTGASSAVDRRKVARDVLQDPELKAVLQEDVLMLFENYLTTRVPFILARILKESKFKKGGQTLMPHELHNIYKTIVAEDFQSHGVLKMKAVNAVKKPFKEFMEHYVETIVTNINK